MPVQLERPRGCLHPVRIDQVVDDPDRIRALARTHGPYFMPARYLVDGNAANAAAGSARRTDVPASLIGPVWRGDWAIEGRASVPDTADLLDLAAFMEAASELCGPNSVVEPRQVFVNLSGPSRGSAFSHVDIPEFVGLDRSNTPGWFLQAMGNSHAFEDVRITIATAVCWFHLGERGYFRYWPEGRDGDSVRHEDLWNTAIMGDNDFMHHKVERIGRDDQGPPEGMTIDTSLDHDGEAWQVIDDGRTLATYTERDIRLSLSWKAHVFQGAADRDDARAGVGAMTVERALDRFAEALDEPLAAHGPDALHSPELKTQLSSRWAGYVPG